MRLIALAIAALALLIGAGCMTGARSMTEADRLSSSNDTDYTCVIFDDRGKRVGTGLLNLKMSTGSKEEFVGSWEINLNQKAKKSTARKARFGEGVLTGKVKDGKVWINLHPDFKSRNVFMRGACSESSFKGKWNYATASRGDVTSGTFIMTAIREE